jgi:hypothetical protein
VVRKGPFLLVAAAAALTAGTCDPRPHDYTLRTGGDPSELTEPPSAHAVKAAILNDVRRDRMLHLRLDEGRRDCPWILYQENRPVCAAEKCRKPLEFYSIKSDPVDQPYRVDEMAFYCRGESLYYYNYRGGPRKLDVWLGPYRLERRRVVPDEK